MREAYSELMKKINTGEFVFTGELEPEKTTDLHEVIEQAKALKGYVTACNVTDNPKSCAYTSPLVASYMVQRDAGMETVYQCTVRDRNRLALVSDLLAAGSLGLKNVLALSGDHTTLGDNPGALPVYDVDSLGLVYLARKMVVDGTDLSPERPEIENPPKFNVLMAGNPNANPLEPEVLKCERKTLGLEKYGADAIQTQVVFEIEKAKTWLKEIEYLKTPCIIGIFPIKSYGMAKFFNTAIPGVSVPDFLMEMFKEAKQIDDKKKKKEKYLEINVEYFTDFCREIYKTTKAAGIHIMAVNYVECTPPLVEAVLKA
ncbi:MAG: methylenetetrahydrofolate reductase [Promethearchaeota archaeon]